MLKQTCDDVDHLFCRVGLPQPADDDTMRGGTERFSEIHRDGNTGDRSHSPSYLLKLSSDQVTTIISPEIAFENGLMRGKQLFSSSR